MMLGRYTGSECIAGYRPIDSFRLVFDEGFSEFRSDTPGGAFGLSTSKLFQETGA